MALLEAARSGVGSDVSDQAARAVFEASHWYEHTVVPGLVGILVGLLAGFAARLSGLAAGVSSLVFASLTFAWGGLVGLVDLAFWAGLLLFGFSLAGAATVGAGVRSWASARPRELPF
jgi:hypothetical protein